MPVLDETFTATIDGPALLNGNPIHVSDVPTLGKATFFGGLTKDVDPRAIKLFSDLAPRVSKIRMIGCAAIDTCHVCLWPLRRILRTPDSTFGISQPPV